MPPAITWLHLSDLHAGAPGKGRDWPVVQDAFASDLGVIRLLDCLRGKLGTVPVVAVPGDHDLVRPKGKGWSYLYSEDAAARAEREVPSA